MAIKAIRPTGLGQPLGLCSHGVEVHGLVVVAGQVGTKPTGEVAGHDAGSQIRQALANVAKPTRTHARRA